MCWLNNYSNSTIILVKICTKWKSENGCVLVGLILSNIFWHMPGYAVSVKYLPKPRCNVTVWYLLTYYDTKERNKLNCLVKCANLVNFNSLMKGWRLLRPEVVSSVSTGSATLIQQQVLSVILMFLSVDRKFRVGTWVSKTYFVVFFRLFISFSN